MFWSQNVIPDKPKLLLVDSSRNAQGWEAEFSERISNVLDRKGVHLAGRAPLRVDHPEDLPEALVDQETFNCIFLIGHGGGPHTQEDTGLKSFWAWLSSYEKLSPKLLAVCTWEDYDPDTSQKILAAEDSFAKFALVPQSPLSARAAGLFFMKFFIELDMHAAEEITGKIVWVSRSKARELLKRRHLPGEIGMRC